MNQKKRKHGGNERIQKKKEKRINKRSIKNKRTGNMKTENKILRKSKK